MKSPILSIIIPVYNSEKSIGDIIAHVLGQDMSGFELILVNDGSTDNSPKILDNFAKKDKRVKVFHKTNGGASSARNLGIEKTRGKFLMFLDADDDIDPTMIIKMIGKITSEKVDLVTCSILFNYIKNDQIISQTNASPRPALTQRPNESFTNYVVRLIGTDGRLYNPCNKIYRSDLIRKNRLKFEVGLDFGEDLTFNLDCLKVTQKIAFIDETLYIYNFNLAENTSGKSSLIYENRQKNYQTVVEFAGDNPSVELSDLIDWVKYYWFYSFVLALCTSPLSRRERIKRLHYALSIDQLPKPGNRRYIGRNKQLMEKVFYILRRTPRMIYFSVVVLNFCKGNRLFAGTWRKLASKLLR